MTDGAPATSKRLALFDQMIAKGSTDPFVYYGRAMELRSLGRTEDALRGFCEVAAQFPDYVPTYLMAAQVAKELARPADARKLARRGIEAARKSADTHTLSELESFLLVLDA